MGCQRLVVLPGGVMVVAGLQELVDGVFAALREGGDPPVPECRRPLVGVPGGVGAERGEGPGRPPVHEMPPRLAPAGHRGQQPGGTGRGHRGGQAVWRLDRRPRCLGHVGLVAGVLLR